MLELNRQQVPIGTYPLVQQNASHAKNPSHMVPKLLVVVVHINGQPARALIDSGSLDDFMSSILVQQLSIEKKELTFSVLYSSMVQESCSRINYGTMAKFQYQLISKKRYFDVINLSGYDVILGTLFLFQHQVTFGLHSSHIVIESVQPLPLEGKEVTQLTSQSMKLYKENVETIQEELCQYTAPICKSASNTPLPLLRAINHTINLIDPNRIYSW